ncbi:MAG: hypothetical protein Q7W51_01585 [Coriobacteriia bacterium]|nr:hypothetical protein [Coriobacteriia bacterium]
MTTGADGRYTLTVDSGEYYLGTMGPSSLYQAGWYNKASGWTDADPWTFWAGTSTTINFTIYRKAPVFRFFNKLNMTHFFTDSIAERDHVIATWPGVYDYEGIAYYTSPNTDLQPLYRFYNTRSNSHFYTASADERSRVIATWPTIFNYDGPTYRVSAGPDYGRSPVYRFYNVRNGSHFYTASLDEANHVIVTWPDVYQFEGPAFWIGQ